MKKSVAMYDMGRVASRHPRAVLVPGRAAALLGAILLAGATLPICAHQVSSPTTDGRAPKLDSEARARLFQSARTICVMVPQDSAQAEMVSTIAAWGRLKVVSLPADADLVMEMRPITVVRASSELRSDDFEGYPFSASIVHRPSGIRLWSTKAVSVKWRDSDGVWAARAVARAFTHDFDKATRPEARR